MQTELSQQTTVPEVAPLSESDESKKPGRGGKRPGAGRKPNLAKRLLKGFSRDAIAVAMTDIDVGAVITSLLKSKRERTKLETLIFVRDTLVGRPAQAVTLSGGLVHAHWTPGCMDQLTEEDIALLDRVTAKIKQPATALLDTPQNHTDSNVARDAIDVAPTLVPALTDREYQGNPRIGQTRETLD